TIENTRSPLLRRSFTSLASSFLPKASTMTRWMASSCRECSSISFIGSLYHEASERDRRPLQQCRPRVTNTYRRDLAKTVEVPTFHIESPQRGELVFRARFSREQLRGFVVSS